MTIGEKIQNARKKAGYTQKQLSQKRNKRNLLRMRKTKEF